MISNIGLGDATMKHVNRAYTVSRGVVTQKRMLNRKYSQLLPVARSNGQGIILIDVRFDHAVLDSSPLAIFRCFTHATHSFF